MQIIALLGGKCKCGFSDPRALQIDHVNGHGNKEKREAGSTITYYNRILKRIKEGSKDYQVLCANCNWIKRHEMREVAWKYEQ